MQLLLVGTVTYDKLADKVVLEDILWTGLDQGHLEKLMQTDSKLKLLFGGLFLAVAAAAGVGLYWRLTTEKSKTARTNNREQARQIFAEVIERPEPELREEVKERLTCIACTVYLKDVACLPCRHVSCCLDCLERLEAQHKNTCVMCKRQVTGVAHIFPQ